MDRSQSNVKKRYQGGREGGGSKITLHVIVINYVKKSGSQHLLKNASRIHISRKIVKSIVFFILY